MSCIQGRIIHGWGEGAQYLISSRAPCGILGNSELYKVSEQAPWKQGRIGWEVEVSSGGLQVLFPKGKVSRPQPSGRPAAGALPFLGRCFP